LVSESVKGSSETVKCGAVREERIRECGSNELASVCGDVTALVIAVDGDVEPEKLDKVRIALEAEQVGEVVRVVLCRIDRGGLPLPKTLR